MASIKLKKPLNSSSNIRVIRRPFFVADVNYNNTFWWTSFAFALNTLLIAAVIWFIRTYGSQKTAILYWFFYLLIIAGNALIWLVLKEESPVVAKRLKFQITLMLLLYIPLSLLAY